MHDGDFFGSLRQPVLVELEFVGGFKGVVAADGNDGIHADGAEPFIDPAERCGKLGIVEMIRAGNILPWVGSRCANQNALRVTGPFESLMGDEDIVLVLLERPFRTVVVES